MIECPNQNGTSAAELFKETRNAPASFAATRAAIGVAAMKGFNASLRDAETTYLQAAIGSPTRAPTFVELPWEWWPDNWFVDDAKRQILKYDRPHCRLLRAPYGHPEAGALWEPKLGDIMKSLGWSSIPGNGGVYVHAKTRAAMVVRVDGMLLLSLPRVADSFWRDLETKNDYKDLVKPLQRYLGALYHFDAFDPKKPKAPRS